MILVVRNTNDTSRPIGQLSRQWPQLSNGACGVSPGDRLNSSLSLQERRSSEPPRSLPRRVTDVLAQPASPARPSSSNGNCWVDHDPPNRFGDRTPHNHWVTTNAKLLPSANHGKRFKGWPSGLEPPTSGSTIRRKHRENADVLSSVAQKVATDTAENGCERLMLAAETDPDLARLVSAWPMLSAVVKRMILAALDADQ